MIDRYYLPELRNIWSDKTRFANYLKIEKALITSYHKHGIISNEVSNEIMSLKNDIINVDKIQEIEKSTKHELVSFITFINEFLSDESKKWFHYGLTSSDILDTGSALQLNDAIHAICNVTNILLLTLKEQALKYKNLICVGRTHGQHADINTIGLKFLYYYSIIKRMSDKLSNFSIAGKLSGAIGNFENIEPTIARDALNILMINESLNVMSTQVAPRDIHAELLSLLAIYGANIEKIATDIRNMSRTEIGEFQEFFDIKKQKGSSAMPQKHNPISCENLCGCARMMRSFVIPAIENIALYDERDISHSSAERFIFEDSTSLLYYMIVKLTDTLKTLVVNETNIKKNFELNEGTIYAQKAMNLLIRHGYSRLDAHSIMMQLSEESKLTNQKLFTIFSIWNEKHKITNANEVIECFKIEPPKNLEFMFNTYLK